MFKGDLYYYSIDHDLTQTAEKIDATRTPLYLLTGEYDWATTPGNVGTTRQAHQGREVHDDERARTFPDE